MSIKRLPFFHRLYLNLATFNRYLKYRFHFDDDRPLTDKCDFFRACDQRKHEHALAAAVSVIGSSLGEVLVVECNLGEFIARLAPHATSVTAIYASKDNCNNARRQCKDFPNVKVQCINVLTEQISGQHDVIFATGICCYWGRLRKVVDKLYHCLRAGGFIIVQEKRLLPEVENSFRARWLRGEIIGICEFFERHFPFVLVQKEVEQQYVTALFQKPAITTSRKSWRSQIPPPLKTAYRRMRTYREVSKFPWAADLAFDTAKQIATSSGSLLSASALAKIREHTLLLEQENIPGDFVECGVYRGGSALLLGDALKTSPIKRHLWLFDSFQGLPAPTAQDGPSAPYLENTLKSDATEVAKLLRDHDVPEDQLTITAGWFQETLHKANIDRIALLHIDADWYSSVKQCLNDLYQLVSPGGIVILDDYNDWPGCKIALDEFLRENNLQVKLEGGSEGPCYFRKQQ